jgi:hypothetical protein
MLELYLNFRIRPHGMMRSELSTGTTFYCCVYPNVQFFKVNKMVESFQSEYCHVVCVTIDGVLIGEWIY